MQFDYNPYEPNEKTTEVSVMNTMEDRELVSSTGHSRCIFVKDHRRRQVTGSRGRQKVIHRGSKKATVQAGKG